VLHLALYTEYFTNSALTLLPLPASACSELNAKLEWYAHASAALGLDAAWEAALTSEASSGSAPGSHPIHVSPPTSLGGAHPAAPAAPADSLMPLPGQAPHAAAAAALDESQEMPSGASTDAAHAASAATAQMVRKNSGSMSQRSVGGEGAAASVSSGGSGPEVAAVEALVAALPLRLSTQVLRNSSQERRGERRRCSCHRVRQQLNSNARAPESPARLLHHVEHMHGAEMVSCLDLFCAGSCALAAASAHLKSSKMLPMPNHSCCS
jgi:hypothetical protein